MTDLEKAKLVASIIKPHFVDNKDGFLMFSVVERALLDATYDGPERDLMREKQPAIEYLKGDLFHCEIAGVSPEWTKELINTVDMGFSV